MTDTTDTEQVVHALRAYAKREWGFGSHVPHLMDQAADALERLAAENAEMRKVCNEADQLLRDLGLDPSRFRTEGGAINAGKIRAALLHPESYAGLYIDGKVCKRCGGRDWQVFTTSAGNMDRCKECGHVRWHEIAAIAEGNGDE